LNQNKIKGAWKKAKGAVKDKTFKWTSCPGTKVKGKAEQAEGGGQSQAGKVQNRPKST
jgi:uncharacterized protein YjbJ (UPF0337 family)